MKSIKFNRSTMMCCITLLSLTASMTSCAKKTSKPTDPVTVTDVDGNVYTTVRIGTQLWMTENLRTTRYKDGTAIPTGLSNTSWGDASAGAFAIYAENNAHNTTYGNLYNWYAVNTGKLAPEGWHVPSRAEWETLVGNLGGSSVAGGKLKAISSLWNAPNLGASNSSGFAALPSGYKGTSGGYELMGESAYWWASSARNASQADYLRVDDDLAGAAINGATKQFGYAVRCIKD